MVTIGSRVLLWLAYCAAGFVPMGVLFGLGCYLESRRPRLSALCFLFMALVAAAWFLSLCREIQTISLRW